MKRAIVASIALCGSLGCADGVIDEPSAMDEVIDERVAIPADEPGVLSFAGAEFLVEPGEDKVMCMSVDYDGEDIAYHDARSLQGRGGHHVVLLGAREPQPAGTVEDCSNSADMAKYEVLMIPQALPPGYGTRLPGGRNMVIQSHYINTTDRPILVRDFVQFDTMPMEDVETWAAPILLGTLDLAVPPHQTAETSFDCVLEQDLELLLLTGHMHEWGTRFQVDVGPSTDELELLYLVDPWRAEFRDVPPVTLYLQDPKPLAKGTILRTSCAWASDQAETLVFPGEMCITVGIVAGPRDPIECRVGG